MRGYLWFGVKMALIDVTEKGEELLRVFKFPNVVFSLSNLCRHEEPFGET